MWLAPFPDATVKAQRGDVSYLKSHSLEAGGKDASPAWPTCIVGHSPYRLFLHLRRSCPPTPAPFTCSSVSILPCSQGMRHLSVFSEVDTVPCTLQTDPSFSHQSWVHLSPPWSSMISVTCLHWPSENLPSVMAGLAGAGS